MNKVIITKEGKASQVAFLTSPSKEDIERERCAKCHWANPETCRICKQGAVTLGELANGS